ncbi:neuropeptide Y receptor type 1 isoform X1 [Podarcis raffonei]|uniref:neuropeptide Y receptor type 1 isoform X1 n=1 Tax=Podarcis raffonei TaxID=65483 RepID=UPI0023293392|nr:neuropeptide Y receptor type 1 isoform X1 [Podarcis raffonei]
MCSLKVRRVCWDLHIPHRTPSCDSGRIRWSSALRGTPPAPLTQSSGSVVGKCQRVCPSFAFRFPSQPSLILSLQHLGWCLEERKNAGNYSIQNVSKEASELVHFEDEDCHVPLAMVFTLALAYGAVILLGISGNLALIIIILKQKEMRNVTNILIVNLSFSDLLITIMCLPFTFVYTLMDHWVFGEAMCKLNPFVQCVSITVSVFSLVLIAIERHQLIINPRGWRPNNRHAYIGIAAIWTLAVASSLPFLVYHILTDEPFTNLTIEEYKGKYVCLDSFPLEAIRLAYTTALLVIQYLGPLCFIFICYLKIYMRLKRRSNMMDKMRDNKYRSTETKRINIMLISIVVAFAVCWLPLTVFNTVFDWNHEILPVASCSHNLLFLICHLTAMISTCVNPIFYGFLNKNFQRDLQVFFRFCDFHPRDDDYETIAMSTMHTDISKTSLKQASPIAFKKISDSDDERL